MRAVLLMLLALPAYAAEQAKITIPRTDNGPSYWQADTAFRHTKPPAKVTGPFYGPLSKPPACSEVPSGIVDEERKRGNCL